MADWTVWHEDGEGNHRRIAIFNCEDEALLAVAQLEESGQEQRYWLTSGADERRQRSRRAQA